ncbi:MAG: integration host factor subunit beta [bacterium]|nr:MAG: integration host factor subunit beta [bacterium]
MPHPKKDSKTTDNSTLATTAKTTNHPTKPTPTTKVPIKTSSKLNNKTSATKPYSKVKVPEPKPVTITRVELAEQVAKAVGRMMEITQRDSEAIVAEILTSMVEGLKKGDKIEIRGFGSFRLRTRQARNGRNPRTGEPVDVPSKTIPYFKMGKDLKDFLKQS